MNERKEPAPLDDLNTRLRAAREEADAAAGRTPRANNTRSGIGFALRLGVELVAALIVGGGIGLLLDRWLETAPWLLVVFFLLGAAAGFMNVYRVMVGMGQTVGYRREGDDKDAEPPEPDRG